MTDKKINKKFLNEAPPIDIPSVDESWKEMQKKLDEEKKERPFIGWMQFYVTAVILLFAVVAGLFLYSDYFPGRSNQFSKKENKPDNFSAVRKGDKLGDQKDKTSLKEKQQKVDSSFGKLTTNIETLLKPDIFKDGSKKMHASIFQKNRLKKLYHAKINLRQNNKAASDIGEHFRNDQSLTDNTDAGKEIQDSLHRTAGINPENKEAVDKTQNSKESIKEVKIIRAGLEWSAQLPLYGVQQYFAGPNSSVQPYRFLLPGVWASLEVEKFLFTIQVNPFAASVLGNKPYATKNTSQNGAVIFEKRTLDKIFGTTAGAGFHYNIKDKWWLGLNLQANFWNAATATVKGEKVNNTGTSAIAYENRYAFNDSSWIGFTKFQMGTGVQLLYKKLKWQAGLRFDFNMLPIIDKAGQKNKTQAQVFVRLPLYSSVLKN